MALRGQDIFCLFIDDERRVQYTLFMQVLNSETGEILFQNKASVTKALVR